MIFSTVSLPSGLPEDTARRTISVSVTMPTSCLPFFTSNELIRADFIVFAALTTDVVGLTDFGLFVMMLATAADMVPPFFLLLLLHPTTYPILLHKTLARAFNLNFQISKCPCVND